MSENIRKKRFDRYIINQYLAGGLDADLEADVRLWLSEDRDPAKWEEIREVFHERVKPAHRPSLKTRRSFREIRQILGFAKNTPIYLRPAFVAAASFILIFGIGTAILWNIAGDSGKVVAENTITVPAHEQKTVELPDGTVVTLKDGSRLAYGSDFLQDRRVTLDGVAFFSVTHDRQHPFTVSSGGVNIKVLGTEFNVDAYSGGNTAEVILTSGSVCVETGEQVAYLQPGQKAVVGRDSRAIEVGEASKGEILKVSGKHLSFDDVRIDEALCMTADYFGKTLVLASDVPTDHYININASASGQPALDDIMQSISQISDAITYRIEGDTIVVSKK